MNSLILARVPIDFQWPVQDPFLFCVHHLDHYPKGDGTLAVNPVHFQGRQMGSDFQVKDGFRMYHGDSVPGFPVHPHRGFETITIVRRGYVDHADSMGAYGRYGEGDVQWMTAGAGVQHSEMFPLLKKDEGNTVELFQIWLNLPKKNKMAKPHFTMFWSESIPSFSQSGVEVKVIAGQFQGLTALSPPPESWANDPGNETRILLVKLKPKSKIEIPATRGSTNFLLYHFTDSKLILSNGEKIMGHEAAQLRSDSAIELLNDSEGEAEFLILQSKPIAEPVVQHGPFVMNTRDEIYQTIKEFQATRFGGWPWSREDMVHGHAIERVAKYPDGHVEKREAKVQNKN